MKKIIIAASLCAALAACNGTNNQKAADSGDAGGPKDNMVKPADSTKMAGKADTPGKSDGAGTGPTSGSSSRTSDSSKTPNK